MNSDIYDELELSNDITYIKEIREQEQNRAARLIQRWYKDRLLKQSEKEAQVEREMLRLRKLKLYQLHVEGRDSLDFDGGQLASAFLKGSDYNHFSAPASYNVFATQPEPEKLTKSNNEKALYSSALGYQSLG